MASNLEFVNYKQFVENLPARTTAKSGDKSIVSNSTDGPGSMDEDILLQMTLQNAEGNLRLDAMRYDGGDITTVNDGYVNQLGNLADVTESFPYKHSDEIPVKSGDHIEVNAVGYGQGVAIIAQSLGEGASYIPLVLSVDDTKRKYEYTFEYDCNIVISFKVSDGADFSLFTKLLRSEKADIVYDIGEDVSNVNVGAVMSNGNLDLSQTRYRYTNDIRVKKGDLVVVYGKGAVTYVAMIAKHSNNVFTPVVNSLDGYVRRYSWTATEDCKVVVTYDNEKYHDVKIFRNLYDCTNKVIVDKLDAEKKEVLTSFDNPIDGYINVALGTIISDSSFKISQPIDFFKGDTIVFDAAGYLTWIGMINFYYEGSYVPIVKSTSSNKEKYSYVVEENCKLVFCYKTSDGFELSITRNNVNYIDNANELAVSCDKVDYSLMFKSLCGIGDSLISGYIKDTSVAPNIVKDCYDYSWLSYLGKMTNSEVKHYSRGGLTAKAWMTETAYHDAFVADENSYGAYFIALGTNDASASYPIGDITDVAGTDSFVGYMKSIIDTVHTKSPNAPIFIVSTYNVSVYNDFPAILEALAGLYNYCYYIDVIDNIKINLRSGGYMTSSNHFTTLGYMYVSNLIKELVSKQIEANLSNFAMYGLYNTEY